VKPSRREFVAAATGALAGGPALLTSGCSAPQVARPKNASPVVDSHVHCFAGFDDPRYPYHPDGPYRPETAARPDQLLRCMDGAGVDRAIIVHPEPYQDDHDYLEHCLDAGKGRLKGTCLFFADRPGSLDQMSSLIRRCPGIVAVRIHAYAPERLPPFGKPELRALWKRAADLGLMVQLHFEPRWAPGFEPLIREFPATPVIIDHLGRPLQGIPEDHDRVIAWSRHPNTFIKLSALLPKDQYPHRDAAPFVRAAVDAFGPDRMIWGGGFSERATPESYLAARDRMMAYVSHLSPADQDKVAGATAARAFKFV
jgi:predicted TIM-barrel fold metal-dependent hydrolase